MSYQVVPTEAAIKTPPCVNHYDLCEITSDNSMSFSHLPMFVAAFLKMEVLTFKSDCVYEVIDDFAFCYCSKLRDVYFPRSVHVLGYRAFANCASLQKIDFPKDSCLESIQSQCFINCKSLRNIELPSKLRFIGEKAFFGCLNLTRLDLSTTQIEEICNQAFELTRVYMMKIPRTCRMISLEQNGKLEKVLVDEENRFLIEDKDQVLYSTLRNQIVFAPRFLRKVFIRRGTERILSLAFSFTMLKIVWIPASVVEICPKAFFNCFKLEKIIFSPGSRLVKIGKKAFSKCKVLERVNFPVSLERIENKAFALCYKLDKIYFPKDSKLKYIGYMAFLGSRSRLILPKTFKDVAILSTFGFYDITSDSEKFVKDIENSTIYEKDTFALVHQIYSNRTNVNIRSETKIIKNDAFFEANLLVINIPRNVLVIESGALSCTSIQVVNFAEDSQLEEIGKNVFSGSKITNLVLPKSLKKLHINALYNMRLSSLDILSDDFYTDDSRVVYSKYPYGLVFVPKDFYQFDIPETVEQIYGNAFYVTKITSICIPTSVRIIGSRVFSPMLKEIVFASPSNCKEIMDFAFTKTMIKGISIPESVEILGSAFYQCRNLTSVRFQDHSRLSKLNNKSFYDCTIENLTFPRHISYLICELKIETPFNIQITD